MSSTDPAPAQAADPANPSWPAAPRLADLVLEGGGVRGIGLVGAVVELAAGGYAFPRVAGSSAGAVVGALVAALQRAGEPLARLADIMRAVDYRRFRDSPLPGPLAPLGSALSLLVHDGLYEGRYLLDFLRGALGELGVHTFGDLRFGGPGGLPADPGTALPQDRRYALVVTASDLSRRRLVRLPWDLPSYGLDPDGFSVAEAVRASASIPFFFRPVTLHDPDGASTLVDGGLLSDFPVALFDRADGARPRFPTFGVRLSARQAERPVTGPVGGPLAELVAIAGTLYGAQDASYVDQPCVQERTVFVDATSVSAVDFDLTPAQRDRLEAAGRGAAAQFLQDFDEAAYLRRCRGFA